MRNKLFLRPAIWQAVMMAAAICLGPSSVHAAERQRLRGHVPASALPARSVERLHPEKRLDLAIALPLRNRESLESLLGQIYDPASTNYHRYLTPEQFAERF